MKIRILCCVFVLCFMAVISYAQNEKVTLKLQQEPIVSVLNKLFSSYEKDYNISPNVQNGVVTLTVNEKPFNTVLTMILSQVNAKYEYKDGVYDIQPNYQNNGNMPGMNQPGMPGAMPGGMNQPGMPGGMAGGVNQPGMPGGMQAGAGMNQMGRPGANGMNGQQQNVPISDPTKKAIRKIKVNYNSPDQILSLMDGDSYADVVYYGSGSSGSSDNSNNNSNSNSNSNSNRNNNSSSRSSNR